MPCFEGGRAERTDKRFRVDNLLLEIRHNLSPFVKVFDKKNKVENTPDLTFTLNVSEFRLLQGKHVSLAWIELLFFSLSLSRLIAS